MLALSVTCDVSISSSRRRQGVQRAACPPPSRRHRCTLLRAARDDARKGQEVDFDRVEKDNSGSPLTSLAVEAESARDSYADTVVADSPGDLVMKDLSYTYKRVQDDTLRAKKGLLFSKELLVRAARPRRFPPLPATAGPRRESSTWAAVYPLNAAILLLAAPGLGTWAGATAAAAREAREDPSGAPRGGPTGDNILTPTERDPTCAFRDVSSPVAACDGYCMSCRCISALHSGDRTPLTASPPPSSPTAATELPLGGEAPVHRQADGRARAQDQDSLGRHTPLFAEADGDRGGAGYRPPEAGRWGVSERGLARAPPPRPQPHSQRPVRSGLSTVTRRCARRSVNHRIA